MKTLLLILTPALLTNGANAQLQSPVFGGKQPTADHIFPKGIAPIANDGSSIGGGSTVHSRSGITLLDSVYYWNLNDTTMAWEVYKKETDFIYDANNNMTSKVIQNWDGGAWVNFQKDSWTYNASDDQTGYMVQEWEGNAWVNGFQYIYTYNSNNYATGYVYQTWSELNSAWVNEFQTTYAESSNNDETGYLFQTWSDNAWVNTFQYTSFTYNVNNNPTGNVYQTWGGNTWVNNLQYTYTYDSIDNLTNELVKTWDNSAWTGSMQYTYTYDSSHNRTSQEFQIRVDNYWSDQNLYTYTYNANIYETAYLYQVWGGSGWVNQAQESFAYTPNDDYLSEVKIDYNGSTITGGDSTYWYYGGVSGINEIPEEPILQLYPNPANSSFVAETNTSGQPLLQIFDITGKLMFTQTIQNPKTTIDASGLAQGIYMVRLKDPDGIGTEKLVIAR